MTIKDQEPSEIQVFSAEEQQLLLAKIEKVAGQIQLVIPETIEEAWAAVMSLEEQAIVNTAKRGFLYMAIKTETEHGNFTTNLKERGISASSAKNAIAVAKMLMALPDSKRQTFGVLNMNKSKLIEMARLPVETVESLDDDDLDTLNDLSVREFRKEIRKLKDKHIELEDQTATLINALETERLTKAPKQMYELPILVAQVRRDAFAHSAVVNESLEAFIAMAEQLCNTRDLDLNHRIGAAQTTWHLWLRIQQRITHMLNRLSGEFGPDHLAGAECIPQFAEDEWQDAQANREYMLAMYNDRFNTK
ncbi:hypothetical protein [Pseudoalteromonas sp. 1_2015MBL_MicDiv]|uniref:hypothetical protein n=1 Tax=Pseudoalteromonas sp. 1_2015MBL_MicDiv TaxID=1720343 RepID=UPI000BBF1CFE|nr:hypothetical protein [Pseudoalteromonas sp. 1_2015MBL_MicDiv]ATG77634.1 hypothetical protein AOR04_08855 [Pseudoalteromonas sp. 1_2015MBL_MicDiv]